MALALSHCSIHAVLDTAILCIDAANKSPETLPVLRAGSCQSAHFLLMYAIL